MKTRAKWRPFFLASFFLPGFDWFAIFYFFPERDRATQLRYFDDSDGYDCCFYLVIPSSIMAEKRHVRIVWVTIVVLFSSVYPLWDRMDRPVRTAIITSQNQISKFVQDITQMAKNYI